MTFSRCLRCNATFSSYKRDQHQCHDLKNDREEQPHG